MCELIECLTRFVEGPTPQRELAQLVGVRNLMKDGLQTASTEELEVAWRLLRHESTKAFENLDRHFKFRVGELNLESEMIDCRRLRRHACALVSSALAARASNESDNRRYVLNAARTVIALGDAPLDSADEVEFDDVSPERANLDECVLRVVGASDELTAAREWIDFWQNPGKTRSASRRIPVGVFYRGTGRGFLAHLELFAPTLKPGPRKRFFEHPEPRWCLRPCSQTLLEAVRSAWSEYKDVCWRVDLPSRQDFPSDALLAGDSLGLAAVVGFRSFERNSPFDGGCLLLGRFVDGVPRGVGGELEKIVAAHQSGIITRVGVARVDENGRERTAEDLAVPGVDVQVLGSIEDAETFAIGEASRLVTYCKSWLEPPGSFAL